MKIKRLVLQGYKTFATKTEFIFDSGLTAVVGPNGSGKSNIADALRWVLGEQSYSSLRGKRTVDMIFAGSQSRARSGMASAILTLDNSEGWLPIDYTEVEIGRRAYRSGENEYILNGQKVRLKDITELLATSGLAERTYTIIGQGLVDKALSLRAEERRALFEEAAGITHYKNRRAETLRRLTDTQRNLQRVHDILNEIQPRLRSLKRQATRAQNYEQISVDLRHLLRQWYGFKWEQAKADMRHVRQTAVVAETIWKEGRQKLLVQQTNVDDLRRQANRLQQRVEESQNQRESIRDQLAKARREAAILTERHAAIERQLADLELELPPLREQQTAAQVELEAATNELSAAQNQLTTAQGELRQFNSNFQAQQKEINRWQQQIKQLEQQRRNAQTKLAQAQGQISQLQERLDEREKDDAQGEAGVELVALEARIGELTAVQTSAQSSVDDLYQKRKTVQETRQSIIRELKQLRREQRDSEQRLNKERQHLARQEARVEMLDQLRQKESGSPKGVTLVGQFAQFLTIPAEHQTAVTAALGNKLATLIVKNDADFWQLIDGAKAGVTAVSLDQINPATKPDLPNTKGIIGWADELVKCQKKAQAVGQLLLGTILLVDSAKTAHQLATQLPIGFVAVAQDGLVAHGGGMVQTDGRFAQNSILAQEEAWREAQAEAEKIGLTLTENEKLVQKKQATIQEKQDSVDEQQREEQRLATLINESNQRVAQSQRNLDRAQQQQNYLQRQRDNRAKELERWQTRITEITQLIGSHRQQAKQADTDLAEAQQQLAALPVAESEQQRLNLQQAATTVQTIVAGRQAVVDSRRATFNQFLHQLQRLEQRQASLNKQQSELTNSPTTESHVKLEEQLRQLEAGLQPQIARLARVRTELRDMEEGTAVTQRQLHELENRHTQTQIKLTQQENQLEALQERIKADLGIVALSYDDDQTGPTPLPMGDVVEELPQVTEFSEDIESTIHQYRGQLQRMGAINPDAPQEYEETLDRFEFMEQQVDDLTATDAQLRVIIDELDDLTSRAFKETVEKVNAVFGSTFTQLFGGGSAQLVLTDPDNLTISGVDILARLPNRREQGLGLLSGGERSLTAVALIFSLLKVSPTPFCVMDEVDAALDEANINRFRELLRELSLNTQFIVITHNRGTVQAAQTIYGISMGSDSTSQAISIRPEEYIKQAELL